LKKGKAKVSCERWWLGGKKDLLVKIKDGKFKKTEGRTSLSQRIYSLNARRKRMVIPKKPHGHHLELTFKCNIVITGKEEKERGKSHT